MKSTKSKIIFSTIAAILGLSLFGTVSNTQAEDICSQNPKNYPATVWEAAGCNNDTNNALPSFIVNILNGIIAVSGLIAVIYVVIGGINYMTSAGDSAKLQKAKSTILYACIGIIIAVLSFAIVNFTISNIINRQRKNQETNEQEKQ